MFQIKMNGLIRKNEYSSNHDEYISVLADIENIYSPNCDIKGVSKSLDGSYGIYVVEKPSNSPVDLSSVVLDPKCNNLLSFKIKGDVVKVKTYHIGNIKNIEFDKPIAGTGVYLGEDTFTVYYPTNGVMPPTGSVYSFLGSNGFSATTFYADGTTSDESVYTQAEYVPS
jgi:hypothetical protein